MGDPHSACPSNDIRQGWGDDFNHWMATPAIISQIAFMSSGRLAFMNHSEYGKSNQAQSYCPPQVCYNQKHSNAA
ncbi:hypothetical protein CEXT_280531 [Caerostris extrusa]|uniref:Uncharacterized protein n=1 Tax=Caerostris extrusa TaxID=172846 RepID=A0AAV4UUG9_CAEEX|nr:hypothetical protein CEXT_280531 [Caerostris extrusa]